MWYLVHEKGNRIRFCSNYYLAQMVADHLRDKLGQDISIATIQKDALEKDFFWDTGSMSLGPKNYTINLPDDIRFSYPSHQGVMLSNFLSSMPKKELFYEFSGSVNTICLTIEQFNVLLNYARIMGT